MNYITIKQTAQRAFFLLALGLLAVLPSIAGAQNRFDNNNGLSNYAESVIGFINGTLVPLLFAIAFIVFIFGVFRFFILGGDNDDAKKSGKSLITYAIIGFIIIVSVWGIVNLLAQALDLDEPIDANLIPDAPTLRDR